ncbi:hypothetical protein Tco_0570172 [Tanacetum coccineum]
MASLKYCDKHNQVGFLKKPEESAGFAEIVDFLKGSHIRYALTHNPTIHDSLVKQFWQTATASTLADGTLELRATIDTLEYTITEASVRSKLQLADASGISMLPNTEIFEGMGNMGYPTDGSFTFWKSFFTPQWRFFVHHILHCISPKSGGWDQFGSNIATALICLSTGRVYNFSKLIFDGMVANLKSKTKFLMYPRFLQMILEIQTESKHPYLAVALTKKIFGNMKRGFRGVPRPLLPAMLPVVAQNAGQADQAGTQSQPSSSTVPPPPTSQPAPTESTTIPPTPIEPTSESDIPQTQAHTHTHEAETGHMLVDDIFQLVPQLMSRIDSLEKDLKQTKQTMENAIVKLKQLITLAEVLSQNQDQIGRNVKTGVRRRLDAEDVSTGFEDVSTGFTDIKSASEKVSSGGEHVSASQREGKAVLEETPQTKRTKKQIREEQASLAEIARIQAEEEAENARREELKRQDELAAKRLQEELELSEAQKKRMAQVQEAAQFYTKEDWDTIRAKLEANADLVKEIAGEDVSEADYAQRMMGLISQRRKLIAEQKAKAQRDKPMTQAQQRQYMATYLKNQGGWKLAQIKKLTDEELKKESRKRTGEELQIESSKKLKSDTREDVSVPKEKDKESRKYESGTEEDVEAYMEERVDEPSSEEFPMSSIPQGPAPAKIVKWQIIKTGKRGAYQIIKEDNTDVINKPEEEFERVLWGGLKTMFDPPSEEDAVWSLTHQQKVLSWRYFHSCAVHCLTLEAAHIYMLTEVKYPLPSRVCQAMLEKRLIGDRKDEVCYQLLKLIEKQAQQQ